MKGVEPGLGGGGHGKSDPASKRECTICFKQDQNARCSRGGKKGAVPSAEKDFGSGPRKKSYEESRMGDLGARNVKELGPAVRRKEPAGERKIV